MHNRPTNDHYLQTAVMTASPARLRLMLLERSVAIADRIGEGRRNGDVPLTDEWTLTLRDLLGELLSGVAPGSGDLGARVADLYVFLLQELTRAEQEPGTERIDAIVRILRIEQETWRQVCEAQVRRNAPAQTAPAPSGPAFAGAPVTATTSAAGSLNLNA